MATLSSYYPVGSTLNGGVKYSNGAVKYPASLPNSSGYGGVGSPTKTTTSNTPSKKKSSSSSSSSSSGSSNDNRIFEDQFGLTQDQYDQAVKDANLAIDKQTADLQGQLKSTEMDKETSMSLLEQALKNVVTQAGTTKSNLQNQAEAATEQGASAARQATVKSRNMLRGLGILNSSAAGDILSRPGTEFQKSSADIQNQLSQGLKQVDDFITQKTEENALQVKQLLSQYAAIVDRIKTDLRFTGAQRLSALQQAKLARDQTLSEIRANQTNYMLAAKQYANSLTEQFGGVQTSVPNITDPSAEILATTPQIDAQTKYKLPIVPAKKKENYLSGNPYALNPASIASGSSMLGYGSDPALSSLGY